jgi:hypothetical protein
MVGVGRRERRAKTLGGDVCFSRSVAECPACRRSVAAVDMELGLACGENLTRGVRRRVAYAAAVSSYSDAERMLRELSGLDVSRAECARVAEQEGKRLDESRRLREGRWLAPVRCEARVAEPQFECERLVLEADAACVLTVKGEEHKSVYSAVAFDAGARGCKQSSGRPYLSEKRYTASALDMDDFGGCLKALANRMGLRQAREVAFVADGAAALWKWADDNLPPETVQIQDYWHVCEHLSHLAQELYGNGEHCTKTASAWRAALRESHVDQIIEQLKNEHKRRRGAKRTRVEQEIKYLRNGRHRMDYARFEAQGWPIGSGAAEATCKHLVKQRMCVTGAHWRRDKIPPIIALRLAIFNDEWESNWDHLSLN